MAAPHHREAHTHDDVDDREIAILDLLRTDGGRVTTGRRAIVRALLTGPDHHVTADDVVQAVQVDHPDVHRSTVYRTLDVLEQLGVVSRVNLGAPSAVYHLADHAHHHLVCEVCGAVTEIPSTLLGRFARAVDERYGFAISGHVGVEGRCAACR